VTIRRLLSHTAGLPGDVAPGSAPYERGLSWRRLAGACLATPLAVEPGTYLRYSNLGPGLVAIVIERITGQEIGAAIAELVLAPLAIEGYLGVEPPRPPARVGGSLGEHEGDELEPYNSAFYRGLGLPWGGMVTTAAGGLALARAFAGVPGGYLPRDLLAEATRDQAGGVPGVMGGFREWPRASWGIGVEVHGDKLPQFAPRAASPESFGHSGHSGCLAWHEPRTGVTWFVHGLTTADRWFRGSIAIHTAIVEASM
jgi:CubicO group peptidase (beta-lactamase class C family)